MSCDYMGWWKTLVEEAVRAEMMAWRFKPRKAYLILKCRHH